MIVYKQLIQKPVSDPPSVEWVEKGKTANICVLAEDGTYIVLTIPVSILKALQAEISAALSASPSPNLDR